MYDVNSHCAATAQHESKKKKNRRGKIAINLLHTCTFCGAFGSEAGEFFRDLGQRVKRTTDEADAYQYLVQTIAMAVQPGNAASVLGSLGSQYRGLGTYELFSVYN